STLYKDSIFNDESKAKIATLEKERLAEVKDKEIQLLNKENALQAVEAKRIYSILGVIVLAVIIIALIQYRNSKHRQKVNTILVEQKAKVESTLSELRSTQTQLIQSEKMANLGDLTAGIAHEIQNPLNFVNNFSEVNNELIDELKAERSKVKSERNEQLEDDILNDIKQNLEKINQHGKRADAIVKNMLQHSRSRSGTKESANPNALCDEYLRLSYHGLRAKDSSFNAIMKTDFDNSVQNINIIPGDIGRVLLNLYNNAFYSVGEKNKMQIENYEPTVSVQTKKINDKIEISVTDNGNGIPQKIVDKIFQPFFTTKPTGSGTGLGLSLSYDIIKAHGGEIKVQTREGEGSEFIIVLPA
ncbi:MAG TPA: ATP-binding protein, partial [Panacibacter sp.]|nr:ATP-binding protein [Panacibacter sp.]